MLNKAAIDSYVIENEKRLKNLCRKFYNGNPDWEDLFQEFYIEVAEMSPERLAKWDIGKLCYWTIFQLHKNRNRKRSNLKHKQYVEIKDYMIKEEIPYTLDIEEFIESELNKPHGFAPVLVFMQSIEEPLRSIERKTGINICALSRFRKEGQQKLQKLCM